MKKLIMFLLTLALSFTAFSKGLFFEKDAVIISAGLDATKSKVAVLDAEYGYKFSFLPDTIVSVGTSLRTGAKSQDILRTSINARFYTLGDQAYIIGKFGQAYNLDNSREGEYYAAGVGVGDDIFLQFLLEKEAAGASGILGVRQAIQFGYKFD